MRTSALVRYNFRVVMFNNWWLLVFPIAISQLTVFWNIVTQKFTPALPATAAEMITPLLAAFLAAHVLASEYSSRVGAILASKPLNIGKVVMLRLLAVLALVWALELLSLLAYSVWMQPYPLATTFLASVPSTLFMAMLAVTFATLLRHPLAGFGVAALYWALQLPAGPPINPYLSLKSYATDLSTIGPASGTLDAPWLFAKVLLFVVAVALYAHHARLVFRLGTPLTQRARRRAIGGAGLIIVAYLVSGACAKVAYGYSRRGVLEPNDAAWFRQQFASFGPVPVAYLFGPAFRAFIGEVPSGWTIKEHEGDADLLGDTVQHRRELKDVFEKHAGSMWAPSAADLYGRLVGRNQPTLEAKVTTFQQIADRYPNSPYADNAIREKALALDLANRRDDARTAYEELLKRRPDTRYRSEALRYIMQNDREHNNLTGAEKWAREWIRVAAIQEKFTACAELAQVLHDRGDAAGARDAANQTLQAALTFRKAMEADQLKGSGGQQQKWDRDAREAEVKARTILK